MKIKKKKNSNLIKKLFPQNIGHYLSKLINEGEKVLSQEINKTTPARLGTAYDANEAQKIEKKYSKMPYQGIEPKEVIKNITKTFMKGIPLWRSKYLLYNVGSAVNTPAATMYALSLYMNIYNINSGLAGNTLLAERAVAKTLTSLAKIKENQGTGLFTFGGTATNLYALKIGINKSIPNVATKGLPSNVYIMVTEDAHFSHGRAADWLGIGLEHVITIKAKRDRTSDLNDAYKKADEILKNGCILACIIINGGTTYDHAIDPIKNFARMLDNLVTKYNLPYRPHLHVDAVIGWAWLVFKNYNFKKNPLRITKKALKKIKMQYKSISEIKYADSWGVDFHKGVGCTPIPCSMIVVNNAADFVRLSQTHNPLLETHQLATEFSLHSPSEYTLETSRPGGAALAALAAIQSMGEEGFQRYLANLTATTIALQTELAKIKGIIILNDKSNGFITMTAFIPQKLADQIVNVDNLIKYLDENPPAEKEINLYMKNFFSWVTENQSKYKWKPEYSYSSCYIKTSKKLKISAIKFYPTSFNCTPKIAKEIAKIIVLQKKEFDRVQ